MVTFWACYATGFVVAASIELYEFGDTSEHPVLDPLLVGALWFLVVPFGVFARLGGKI